MPLTSTGRRTSGRSWQRIIDDTDVWGYVLCFAQDPVEPGLMFAGTEYGLYVSFDGGDSWNRWTSGYPTVSTYDMVIQPREHDLVIGTFGRGIWVLDDIRPLRALAATGKKLLNSRLTAFEVPEAWMVSTKNLPGYYFYGDAMYRGENREPGAMVSFYTAEPGKVTVEIKDAAGKLVKSTEWDATKGFNRVIWRLDRNPLPQATYPSGQQMQDPRARYYRNAGGPVIPGILFSLTEKGLLTVRRQVVKVSADPRMAAPDTDALVKNLDRAEAFGVRVNNLNGKLKFISTVRESLARSEELIARNPGFAEAMTAIHKTVNEELAKMDEVFGRRQDGLVSRINGYRSLLMASGVPSQQEEKGMTDAVAALEEAEKLIDGFMEGPWKEYAATLKKINLTIDSVIIR